jgi:thymidylate synthase
MIAQQCDLGVGDFQIVTGDTHLYDNHLEQAKLQLMREPYPLSQLKIRTKPATIFDYTYEDFEIENYQFHPHIPARVAV